MSRKQLIVKWVSRAITVAIFSWYYVAVCTLCWLFVTPDVVVGLDLIMHNSIWNTLVCWGVISGVFLFANAFFEGAYMLAPCFRGEGRWQNALTGLGDILVGCGILFVPFIAMDHTMFLRAMNHPAYLLVLTGLFLLTVTDHFISTKNRVQITLKGAIYA